MSRIVGVFILAAINVALAGTGDDGDGGFMSCDVDKGMMWCYPTQYGQDGQPDWEKEVTPVCVSESQGCPCNADFEKKCPGAASYCLEKQGQCQLTCGNDEILCEVEQYDAQGTVQNSSTICANQAMGCPCNAQFEDKCVDSSGWSHCSPKGSCPVECKSTEQHCYLDAFKEDGSIDYDSAPSQSCHPINGTCPCHPTFQESCVTEWGTECFSKGSCPVACSQGQKKCYPTSYNSDGQPDWEKQVTPVCVSENTSCPCNATFEQKCTDTLTGFSWCNLKTDPCPLSCLHGSCWDDQTGNESCATATGCSCKASDHSCVEYNWTMCWPKTEYPNGCPTVCDDPAKPFLCSEDGFDTNGSLIVTAETCASACTVSCNSATANLCNPGPEAFCVPKAEACPVTCSDTNDTCYVAEYDAQGAWISDTIACVPLGSSCPCGANTAQCKDPEGSAYCEHVAFGCPVSCDPGTEKSCFPVSFTSDGEFDTAAQVNVSCVKLSQSCPCGKNAKLCRITDEYNLSYEECFPASETCPVNCQAGQKTCAKTDYNSSGYPIKTTDTCVPEKANCPCGKNTEQCSDPDGFSWCLPARDFWSNQPQSCPVFCTATQESCFITNYDSGGLPTSSREICIAQGGKCDCTLGTNAMTCNRTEDSYSWTECLPLNGGFCPKPCSPGQVSCDAVDDYDSKGVFLRSRIPNAQCANTLADCGCGKNAVMCKYSDGWAGCAPKSEGCPVECKAGENKCFINDFDANGEFIRDRESCVAANATCPCGKNTVKCPADGSCWLASEFGQMCPCKASERECYVDDFSGDGRVLVSRTVCIQKGAKCPCSKNAHTCADPFDANENICSPKTSKDGKASCPKPCTPEQEKADKETCIQVNRDRKGEFVSETISCVPAGKCKPGTNSKKCPGGAMVALTETCKNLYGNLNSTSAAVDSSVKQSSELVITVLGTANAAQGAATAAAAIGSKVMAPSTIKISVTAKSKAATTGGRRLSKVANTVKVNIENTGASKVSPAQIMTQMLKQIKSGEMDTALKSLGSIDKTKPPTSSNRQTTITTRASAAAEIKQKQATASSPPSPTPTPVAPTTPTPSTPSPPSPTPTPSTPSPPSPTLVAPTTPMPTPGTAPTPTPEAAPTPTPGSGTIGTVSDDSPSASLVWASILSTMVLVCRNL